MRRVLTTTLGATACAALLASGAAAQTARSGGGDARAAQQLQQLAQERTQLQAENTKLKRELEQAKGELATLGRERDALKSRASGAEAAAARARAGGGATEQALADTRGKLDELVGRFRQTAEQLREVEGDHARLQREAAERGRALDACTLANVELYEITGEVLTRYENGGLGERVGRAEPFTRLTRTRIENLVDGYRARAEELRVDATRRTSATPTSPPTGP